MTAHRCWCGHRLARHDRQWSCTEPNCRCELYDTARKRCIVHDLSYEKFCNGCESDRKAAS